MCTSLTYTDTASNVYFGRTLELTVDLPYEVAYFPAGFTQRSELPGQVALDFQTQYAVLAVTMPGRLPTPAAPIAPQDLKVLEGMNNQGLTFSLLSYPAAAGPQDPVAPGQAVLSASDLGLWALGRFATVAEFKAALQTQPVMLESLALLGGVQSPFHYVAHDASGASLVIEFTQGKMAVHDNPVGVMTNGPDFPWHLTNLHNYTHLTNVDQSSATFCGFAARQPDSGIATASLPASNTSVGRFVKAVFYSQFTEKADTPEQAVRNLAHIMNNFDRPRGITIDYPDANGGGHMEVPGLSESGDKPYATEFTCWTSLSDLSQRHFYLRDYNSLNFVRLDLSKLAGVSEVKVLPLAKLASLSSDGTDAILSRPA